MLRRLIADWWIISLRGLIAIGFGVLVIFLVGTMTGRLTEVMAMLSILLFFAVYLIVAGVLSGIETFRTVGHTSRWWLPLLHAFFVIGLGTWLWASDYVGVRWLTYLAAAHGIAMGTLDFFMARKLQHHWNDVALLRSAGAISFFAAAVLLLLRNAPLDLVLGALGTYAVTFGAVLIVFSLRLHAFHAAEHRILKA